MPWRTNRDDRLAARATAELVMNQIADNKASVEAEDHGDHSHSLYISTTGYKVDVAQDNRRHDRLSIVLTLPEFDAVLPFDQQRTHEYIERYDLTGRSIIKSTSRSCESFPDTHTNHVHPFEDDPERQHVHQNAEYTELDTIGGVKFGAQLLVNIEAGRTESGLYSLDYAEPTRGALRQYEGFAGNQALMQRFLMSAPPGIDVWWVPSHSTVNELAIALSLHTVPGGELEPRYDAALRTGWQQDFDAFVREQAVKYGIDLSDRATTAAKSTQIESSYSTSAIVEYSQGGALPASQPMTVLPSNVSSPRALTHGAIRRIEASIARRFTTDRQTPARVVGSVAPRNQPSSCTLIAQVGDVALAHEPRVNGVASVLARAKDGSWKAIGQPVNGRADIGERVAAALSLGFESNIGDVLNAIQLDPYNALSRRVDNVGRDLPSIGF